MNRQLKAWVGTFGNKWGERNCGKMDMDARRRTFKKLFSSLYIPGQSVFEIGCNTGHNLLEIQRLGYSAFGCEPNLRAFNSSIASNLHIYNADGASLKNIKSSTFGMVFTSCVLIHTNPFECHRIMNEMARISKKYVLFMEYFAKRETQKVYRGHKELLFKRNFAKKFAEEHKDFELLKMGELTDKDGFDRTTWALFKRKGKNDCRSEQGGLRSKREDIPRGPKAISGCDICREAIRAWLLGGII